MLDQKELEKIPLRIFNSSEEASVFVANEIAALIKIRQLEGKPCVLGLATGSTPTRGLPVLHHIWQHRRRQWPSQDISDGVDLSMLATRHPRVSFILAHIGGGGDYAHTFAAVRDVPNIYLDLSGSGTDRGMMDDALAAVGARRLLWGADITLCTGLAKLWALDGLGLDTESVADIRWRNAVRIFPAGAFPGLPESAHA